MKYSMFMMPLHPPGRNISQTLQEDRQAVILADRLGYSEAYVGEHVTDAAETVTSSMIFLASLIHDVDAAVVALSVAAFVRQSVAGWAPGRGVSLYYCDQITLAIHRGAE